MYSVNLLSARHCTRTPSFPSPYSLVTVFEYWQFFLFVKLRIFSDISERNNDYSDALDFRRGWVGELGVVTFFVLEVPDNKFAMLIYLYMCKNARYRSQFWTDLHEMVGAVHSWVNPIVFGNNRPNRTTNMGESVPLKPVFQV